MESKYTWIYTHNKFNEVNTFHEFRTGMLPCRADGNPLPTVQWYYQGELINASEPLTRSDSGEYMVEAVNTVGTSRTSVNITIEYKPLFRDCSGHYTGLEHEFMLWNLSCQADGNPTPTVRWYYKEELIIASQPLNRSHSGEYRIEAENGFGESSTFQPTNMEKPITCYILMFCVGLVTPGQNITFECSAEGNPSPDIRWSYTSAGNVMETTGGLQRSISVTGATSTNAGVYVCVAVNKVGRVSRSVTLIMKVVISCFYCRRNP
uniref:Ig-like domain-containing protein n=1 Tax=Mola mola TaxID=94237 RepID=A0A3Q3X025_MOLML